MNLKISRNIRTSRRIYNDIITILRTVKTSAAAFDPPSLAHLGRVHEFTEVSSLSAPVILGMIRDLHVPPVTAQVQFSFKFPSRAGLENHEYIPQIGRIVLKSNANVVRSFHNMSTRKKALMIIEVLEAIKVALENVSHLTKREIFYKHPELFGKQASFDSIVDYLCCMFRCTRSSLNIIADQRGTVIGDLIYDDNGCEIDCTPMGVTGKTIPTSMEGVNVVSSNALFVLIVEKDATFVRLAENKFYENYPCIIITARGQPDVVTRLFLRLIKEKRKLPILALVDCDPYGLKIQSVYTCGSLSISYDSLHLANPYIKWLGIMPDDLERFNIHLHCMIPMSKADKAFGENLLKHDFVKKKTLWFNELQKMLNSGQKTEIQALCSFGSTYLTDIYLPLKLQELDLVQI